LPVGGIIAAAQRTQLTLTQASGDRQQDHQFQLCWTDRQMISLTVFELFFCGYFESGSVRV
jgi:hypothetical protein